MGTLTLPRIAAVKAIVDLLAELELDALHLHVDTVCDHVPDVRLWLRTRTDFERYCEATGAKKVTEREQHGRRDERSWFVEQDTAEHRLLVQVVSLPHHDDWVPRGEDEPPVAPPT